MFNLFIRFYRARETTQRMNAAIFDPFRAKIEEISQAFKVLKTLMKQDIQERLRDLLQFIATVRNQMQEITKAKQTIYNYQKYSLQKNFMRARDAMEERTFSPLCFGFREHVFRSKQMFDDLSDAIADKTKTQVAISLYIVLTDSLKTKTETARNAFDNYTQLYEAYGTGDRIFNYKFKSYPRAYNSYINPRHLLNKSLTHNSYARRYSSRVGEDILRVMNATVEFQEIVHKIMNNTSENLIHEVEELLEEFVDACEDYYHSKSTFYFETIDRPVRIIQSRINIFKGLKEDHLQSVFELQHSLEHLNHSLRGIQENFLERLSTLINDAKGYIHESNVTKMQLCDKFTSKSVTEDIHSMEVFFADLRHRAQFVYDKLFEIKETCSKIWTKILTDKDSVEYYTFMQMDKFLQNITDVEEKLKSDFKDVRQNNDLRFVIGNTDSNFIKAMETLIEDLKIFKDGNRLNDEFVRYVFDYVFLYLRLLYMALLHINIWCIYNIK